MRTGRPPRHNGMAARIREALVAAPEGKATFDQIRQVVPDATSTAISAMCRSGMLIKEGLRCHYRYSVGRTPQRVNGVATRKPQPHQQFVISPAHGPAERRARGEPGMSSQEWEALGGKVQRLPRGAVSQPVLRFRYGR